MMGIYVRYADYDDFTGECDCKGDDDKTPYPVLKELQLGWSGEASGGKLITCDSWAKHND